MVVALRSFHFNNIYIYNLVLHSFSLADYGLGVVLPSLRDPTVHLFYAVGVAVFVLERKMGNAVPYLVKHVLFWIWGSDVYLRVFARRRARSVLVC